jgi:hypothetical protein
MRLVSRFARLAVDLWCDMSAHAINAAITSGALLDPGTRELVLYLADALRTPATPKELKDGWEAPTKYFFGFMDTAKFTKSRVPSAEAWLGLQQEALLRWTLR